MCTCFAHIPCGPLSVLPFQLICGTHYSQVMAQAGHSNSLKEYVGSEDADLNKSLLDCLMESLLL